MSDLPKAPRQTAAQRRTERAIERVEYWRASATLLSGIPGGWANGVDPYDVLALARFLAGDAPEPE
ncbi:hypothetical protein TG1_36 [Streptomyces phage TG1]|uniref:Uncharacterized protein n=1 Tax=Streptomyces phage TG1 TaxID=2927987 RepID=K4HYK8_9CAUD|nr:hypothetical protein D281_gp36 [Streptomyces phage TG1]AFU62231.1 hypothetical protein TG1_36 [Streptomyces phage TG1]